MICGFRDIGIVLYNVATKTCDVKIFADCQFSDNLDDLYIGANVTNSGYVEE